MSSLIYSLTLTPIGIIRTSAWQKFDSPHQPDTTCNERSVIELFPHHRFEFALKDLEGFERIWLIWWFHRNSTWRPLVLPPRGKPKRRGVFATRSPHRPNPIGITSVPLIKIEGLKLTIGPHDLLDGTPILDIKPYISGVDAFPNVKNGWVDELEVELAEPSPYEVAFTSQALEQHRWLQQRGIDFISRAQEILQRDPLPHKTRRIRRIGENLFRMGCGGWRLFFSINDRTVQVEYFGSGYPSEKLIADKELAHPNWETLLQFEREWPSVR